MMPKEIYVYINVYSIPEERRNSEGRLNNLNRYKS